MLQRLDEECVAIRWTVEQQRTGTDVTVHATTIEKMSDARRG
jgi:hypothetical protein